MNFFQANINPNSTICVHPLLVSLSEAVHASASSPDISSISENDKRALRSNFYTSPSKMPPLEIHSLGQNGPSLLSNINGYALMSVAGCRECMGLAPQDNSGEGNATQQFGSNIPCPGRQFRRYRQHISERTQQREEASTCFFQGYSRQSLELSWPKGSWGNTQTQGKTGAEGRFTG